MAAGLWLAPQGDSPPSSEERCVGVVEGMVATGNWLVPYLEGEPRLQKPPLYYWAGAAAVELTHRPVVVALRNVSVLVSLALAAAVFAYGSSLGGFVLGFASAAAVGASFLFYQRGRVGDAEPLLALLTFLALAAFETLWRTRDRRWLPALAAAVGLAFLTKATAALLDVFLPILAWLALHRSLGLALRPRVVAWAAVALAISLSWYAAILVHVPDSLALFREYLIGPLGVHAGGRDATHARELWYYLRFPLFTAPVGILLPWVAWRAWKTRGFSDDPVARFLVLGLVTLFVAWSLVPSKQMHYLLPLVPLQALLLARVSMQWWRRRPSDERVGTLPTPSDERVGTLPTL
jgi:4-amino-4-deoxy-L-arabinose transferase-like glycosyltransferase